MGEREGAANLCKEIYCIAFHLGDQAKTLSYLHPMDGELLPLDRSPKILGVTFDTHFHFHRHIEAIEEEAKQRLFLLKALTGTTWDQHNETLIAT